MSCGQGPVPMASAIIDRSSGAGERQNECGRTLEAKADEVARPWCRPEHSSFIVVEGERRRAAGHVYHRGVGRRAGCREDVNVGIGGALVGIVLRGIDGSDSEETPNETL